MSDTEDVRREFRRFNTLAFMAVILIPAGQFALSAVVPTAKLERRILDLESRVAVLESSILVESRNGK